MISSRCINLGARVPSRTAIARVVMVMVMLGLCLGQTGCVTSKKYKMAKEGVPPAQPLGWTVTTPPVELTLQSLIVYKGPGSWKREAKWDEYVVQLSNHGGVPLTIGTATLIDILGQPQVPGNEPWALEKLSYTNWDKYGGAGLSLVAGAGVVAIYGGIAMTTVMSSYLAGPAGAAASSVGGAAVALTVIPIAAVVDITAVAIINHQNKEKVQAEFDRRRLVLPLTVAPGATVSGSLFFPMTPGPKRLIVKGTAGDVPVDLVLELKQLAGLHLKPAKQPPTP